MKCKIFSALLILATVLGVTVANTNPSYAQYPGYGGYGYGVPMISRGYGVGMPMISHGYGGYGYPPPYYRRHCHRHWHRHW